MPKSAIHALVAAGLVLGIALAPGASAEAQRIDGSLEVLGGYDSRPGLAVDATHRRVPTAGGPVGEDGEGVFVGRGTVAGEIGELVFGAARLDLEGQVYGSGRALGWERLRLELGLALPPLRARCGPEGMRLDVGVADDGAWTVGARCAVTVQLPEGLFLGAHGELAGRFFDSGQEDVLAGGGGSLGLVRAPFAIELGLRATRRESDERRATRTELSPFVELRVDAPFVGGALGYRAVIREFDQGAQNGVEHLGRASVWGMPLPWLGGMVEVQLGLAHGESQALVYERVQVVGGVRVVLDWRAPATSAEPTTVEDGRTRFRFHLPGARRVAVIGEHNGWDEEAGRLTEITPGVFEGEVELSPGRYLYALIVDGEARTPPGATRTVDDGLGGRSAVLIVPE